MWLKNQRYENPPPGQTLLLYRWSPWKDPRKAENTLAPLESEKGMIMPTWAQLSAGTALYFLVSAVHCARLRRL